MLNFQCHFEGLSQHSPLIGAEQSYLAQSVFGEYKNETDTKITQNANAINLNSNDLEAVNNELEFFKKENNANLEIKADAILSQVENIFSKKSDFEAFNSEVSSQITQTAENITENFSEKMELVNSDMAVLSGTVAELIYSVDAYIKRGELEDGVYGIEIGRSDSNIKARFTNDKLSFYQGSVQWQMQLP